MAKTVSVTKVTVEYAFEGQTFTVVFTDPAKIDSIVFSRRDFDRLSAKQNELAALTPAAVRRVKEHLLKPGGPFPRQVDGDAVLATSTPTGTAPAIATAEDRSLWWHTDTCNWFHPEDE